MVWKGKQRILAEAMSGNESLRHRQCTPLFAQHQKAASSTNLTSKPIDSSLSPMSAFHVHCLHRLQSNQSHLSLSDNNS